MPKVAQTFKQLPLLRNILTNKRSGSIHYRFSSQAFPEKINVTTKKLSGPDIEQQVQNLITLPTYACEWNSQIQSTPNINTDDIIPCICAAIRKATWLPHHALALKRSFLKMPAIQVDLPNPEIKYPDMGAYMALYHFTKNNPDSSPANFLETAYEDDDKIRYLKVLVLVYCLGFMSSKTSKKESIATRILNRIRQV